MIKKIIDFIKTVFYWFKNHPQERALLKKIAGIEKENVQKYFDELQTKYADKKIYQIPIADKIAIAEKYIMNKL